MNQLRDPCDLPLSGFQAQILWQMGTDLTTLAQHSSVLVLTPLEQLKPWRPNPKPSHFALKDNSQNPVPDPEWYPVTMVVFYNH